MNSLECRNWKSTQWHTLQEFVEYLEKENYLKLNRLKSKIEEVLPVESERKRKRSDNLNDQKFTLAKEIIDLEYSPSKPKKYRKTPPKKVPTRNFISKEGIAVAKIPEELLRKEVFCPICGTILIGDTSNKSVNDHVDECLTISSLKEESTMPPAPKFEKVLVKSPIIPPAKVDASKFIEQMLEKDLLEECANCFEPYLKGQNTTRLECFCFFHSGCWQAWKVKSQTCPIHRDT